MSSTKILFLLFIFLNSLSSTASDQTGVVVVGTTPSSLQIWINDVYRGNSPLSLPILSGTHSIRIVDPVRRTSLSEKFTVHPTDTCRIERSVSAPSGGICIKTEPEGGTVSICTPLGSVPFSNATMTPGRYVIRIDPPDRLHGVRIDSVLILAGEETRISGELPGRIVLDKRAAVRGLLGLITAAGVCVAGISQNRYHGLSEESPGRKQLHALSIGCCIGAGISLAGLEIASFF